MYDFFLYEGKNSTGGNSYSVECIALRLSERIPKNKEYRLFFDNWFWTFDLMLQLKSSGIYLQWLRSVTTTSKNVHLLQIKNLKRNGVDHMIIEPMSIQSFIS